MPSPHRGAPHPPREPRIVEGARDCGFPGPFGVPSATASSVEPPLRRRHVLTDIPLTTIDGAASTLADYAPVKLIVNVASRCGLAPQYEKLEELQKTYGDRGFTVLGFPSNQFLQELSDEDKIKEYCSTTWGVTFPMFEKVKVNGKSAHPLYAELTKAEDEAGKAGKVKWNFEKFLVTADGTVHRFRPTVEPDDPRIVSLIEASLPAQ
ncbi:glutathione peroxidase [Rathayibacter sp. SD072]|nr:glutathione peroxidase [Rathayibacter sp. SD072]